MVENEPAAYACINKDDSIRMESSSGGVFTLIAEQVISEGGIVIGAEFNIDFEVEHNSVERIEDLDRLRGSKICPEQDSQYVCTSKRFS